MDAAVYYIRGLWTLLSGQHVFAPFPRASDSLFASIIRLAKNSLGYQFAETDFMCSPNELSRVSEAHIESCLRSISQSPL